MSTHLGPRQVWINEYTGDRIVLRFCSSSMSALYCTFVDGKPGEPGKVHLYDLTSRGWKKERNYPLMKKDFWK